MPKVNFELGEKAYKILRYASKVSKISESEIISTLIVVNHLNMLGLIKLPKVKK